MTSVYGSSLAMFQHQPSPTPSLAYSTTSSGRTIPVNNVRKRAASVSSSTISSPPETPQPSPARRRLTGSRASDKAEKKALRMERNRIAAQASRDRKRMQQEALQRRIDELEHQLAVANMAVASPSSSTTSSLQDGLSGPSKAQLMQENESLKHELEVERQQSATLKSRLGSLEAKFLRLEGLLSNDAATTSVAQRTPPASTPSSANSQSFQVHALPTPANGEMPFSTGMTSDVSSSGSAPNNAQPQGSTTNTVNTDQEQDNTKLNSIKKEPGLDNLSLSARDGYSLPRRLSKTAPSKTETQPLRRQLRPSMETTMNLGNPSAEQARLQCIRQDDPRSQPRQPHPTLHDILSAITIPELSSTTEPSGELGMNGLKVLSAANNTAQLYLKAISTSTRGYAPPRKPLFDTILANPESTINSNNENINWINTRPRNYRRAVSRTIYTIRSARYQPFTRR